MCGAQSVLAIVSWFLLLSSCGCGGPHSTLPKTVMDEVGQRLYAVVVNFLFLICKFFLMGKEEVAELCFYLVVCLFIY